MSTIKNKQLLVILVIIVSIVILYYINKKEEYGILDRLSSAKNYLLDKAKKLSFNLFSSIPDETPGPVRTYLQRYGSARILSVTVCRKPLMKVIQGFINLISMGALNRNSKKYGYDDLYHLYLLINVETSSGIIHYLKVEKNQRVMIIDATREDFEGEGRTCINVYNSKYHNFPITLNSMFNKAIALQGKGFWIYDSLNKNCQVFALNMLNASNLITYDIEQFINQKASELLKGHPLVKKISRVITNLAGNIDRLVYN